MWHLYLDESGDLGFDFVNKRPSKFFTICILAVGDSERDRSLAKAVRITLHRKFSAKSPARELKGSKTSISIKKYFYGRAERIHFGIYAITLNKRKLYEHLTREKERIYNYVARLVLDQIPFESAVDRVQLVVDKCKAKPEIQEFNAYVISHLRGRLNPKVSLHIDHHPSHENLGLQAADLFAWGIFRKYEKSDLGWFGVYKAKVRYDSIFLH